jgi:hypothetical protein
VLSALGSGLSRQQTVRINPGFPVRQACWGLLSSFGQLLRCVIPRVARMRGDLRPQRSLRRRHGHAATTSHELCAHRDHIVDSIAFNNVVEPNRAAQRWSAGSRRLSGMSDSCAHSLVLAPGEAAEACNEGAAGAIIRPRRSPGRLGCMSRGCARGHESPRHERPPRALRATAQRDIRDPAAYGYGIGSETNSERWRPGRSQPIRNTVSGAGNGGETGTETVRKILRESLRETPEARLRAWLCHRTHAR